MKFRHRESRNSNEPERIPKVLPVTCLGERCVNFAGIKCSAYEELLQAGGDSGAEDLPPYQRDATFTIYGRICVGGESEEIVSVRANAIDGGVGMMELIARGDRYGVPMTLGIAGQEIEVQTTVTSQHE